VNSLIQHSGAFIKRIEELWGGGENLRGGNGKG